MDPYSHNSFENSSMQAMLAESFTSYFVGLCWWCVYGAFLAFADKYVGALYEQKTLTTCKTGNYLENIMQFEQFLCFLLIRRDHNLLRRRGKINYKAVITRRFSKQPK